MEEVEIHFFHGFLGLPSDWDKTINNLSPGIRPICHNLLEDIQSSEETLSFKSWAALKNSQINNSNSKKIVVGYSLGGRMAMHLNLQNIDGIVFLASHPGLLKAREQRVLQDRQWLDLARDLTFKEWLIQWNNQEIFKYDIVRPKREFSNDEWNCWLNLLQRFSLGQQELQDAKLNKYRSRCFWMCGEKDYKFLGLKDRIQEILGFDRVEVVSGAGHGVLFDKPQELALKIKKVVDFVQ